MRHEVGEERDEGFFDLTPDSKQPPSIAVVTMSSSSVCIQSHEVGDKIFCDPTVDSKQPPSVAFLIMSSSVLIQSQQV